MAIESIAHVLEEIDWEGIIRKIIGQKPEGALDTEQVSLTPAGPVEEAAGGDAPPVGDEIARQHSWFFWQKLIGLQGPINELVTDLESGTLQDISSEVKAGRALVPKLDELIAQYNPDNPFLNDYSSSKMYSEIVAARNALNSELNTMENLREQLTSGTLNEAERNATLEQMKQAKEVLAAHLKNIQYTAAIRQA